MWRLIFFFYSPRCIRHLDQATQKRICKRLVIKQKRKPVLFLNVNLNDGPLVAPVAILLLVPLMFITFVVGTIAIYIFFVLAGLVGIWSLRRKMKTVRKRIQSMMRAENLRPATCFDCGYDLRNSESETCPECGCAVTSKTDV